MKNGRSEDGERPDNVTSFEAARRKAETARREAERSQRGRAGPRSLRDWVIGGVLFAMAAGAVWSFLAPLFRTAVR